MNNPSIHIVNNNKKEFLQLLLLCDELESDIEKYKMAKYIIFKGEGDNLTYILDE